MRTFVLSVAWFLVASGIITYGWGFGSLVTFAALAVVTFIRLPERSSHRTINRCNREGKIDDSHHERNRSVRH